MVNPLLIALLFYCLINQSIAAETYMKFDLFNYAEPTSINSFLHEFNGDFEGGTQAFAHEWMEVGVRMGNWELGLLTRYDYDLSFSKDAAELYYLATNGLPLEDGRNYHIDISAKHYKTNGLRLGYLFQADDTLEVALGFSYLQGLKLTDGNITGEATVVAENDYDYAFHADYYYSEDPLFDRVAETPSGWGYSMDLAIDWRPITDIGVHLQARDLLGKLYWKDAPHTIADADSNNKTYDEDGYVIFNPTLRGLEEYRDFTQSLYAFGSVSADYRISSEYELLYHGPFTKETFFSGFGAAYAFDAEQRLAMVYYPEIQAFEVDLQGSFWKFNLASDAFTLNRAHYLVITGYLGYRF